MRRIDLYLEAVSVIDEKKNIFEQLLDSEFFWLQVTDCEKLKSSVCFENIVIGIYDSLYRI